MSNELTTPTANHARVVLAFGGITNTVPLVVQAFIGASTPIQGIIVTGDRSAPDRALAERVATALSRRARIITPRPFARQFVTALASRGRNLEYSTDAQWDTIDLRPRGGTFYPILIDQRLDHEASITIGVTTGPLGPSRGGLTALALWASYSHPRHAALAHLNPNQHGIQAELALARPRDLTIHLTEVGEQRCVIAGDDPLAVALVGLALDQSTRVGDGDHEDQEVIGPWEHPLVQHAANLDLGVSAPATLRLETHFASVNAAVKTRLTECVARARERLGLAAKPLYLEREY